MDNYDPVCGCGVPQSQHSDYDNHSFVEVPTFESMSAELDTARASEARLREALRPFARTVNMRDRVMDWFGGGDFTEAAHALSGSSGEWLERHDAEHDAAEFQRGWRCGVAAITEEKAAEIERSYGIIRGQTEELAAAVAARDSYRALVDAGTAACAEVDARCAALQEKCDGYAAALDNSTKEWCDALESVRKDMNDGVEFENPFLAVSARRALATLDDRWTPAAILLARDARIAAEARRKALLEVYERVKNLRGCNAYDVIDSIEEMAKETTNG